MKIVSRSRIKPAVETEWM